MRKKYDGSVEAFDENWKKTKESLNIYWTKKNPVNQIELSFQMFWKLFIEIIKKNKIKGKKILEVGAGRGTISAYFSDHKYETTLMDSSTKAIQISKKIFKNNNLNAKFIISDINRLKNIKPEYDIIFSYGLMEHFKDIKKPLINQINLLNKGGLFLAYIVPDYRNKNVQKNYLWINSLITSDNNKLKSNSIKKSNIYRNNYNSSKYIKILSKYLRNINSSGVYPLPMISSSVDFPFTLLKPNAEVILINHFKNILKSKLKIDKSNQWLCKEGYGQAFIVWGVKK